MVWDDTAVENDGATDAGKIDAAEWNAMVTELKDSTVSALNNHTDVVITGVPADNELLAYDTGTSKWINQTQAEAAISGGAGGSGGTICANYLIIKDADNLYKALSAGALVSSDADISVVLNAVSADLSDFDSATIVFNGNTEYTWGTGLSTVTFDDKFVYIDGSNATFDFSNSDCTVFYWHGTHNQHHRGGIKNVQLIGDITNTNQTFACFYHVCADIYNLTTHIYGCKSCV